MNMRGTVVGITNQNDREPECRGARVAAYVEAYLRQKPGLSLGELAFRLRVDKRDLRRLLNDQSIGWRLEDNLAAYFGDDFIETVFRPVIGDRGSQRLREIERERSEIAARESRLASRRTAARQGGAEDRGHIRLVPEQARARPSSSGREG